MSYMPPNSPLFTASQLAPVSSTGSGEHSFIPQLPEKPTFATGSMQMYIIPTEKNLFFQGFTPAEYSERQPVLLRGCLFLRVLKPSRVKSITLTFKGNLRTDWPEGIPPKKNVFYEETDIMSHTWPFYSMSNPMNSINGGADLYSELPKTLDRDITHLNLNDPASRSHSPSLNHLDPNANGFLRSMSPASGLKKRSNTTNGASPMIQPVDSFADLQTINTGGENEVGKPGLFPPGDYIYNFEHPLRPSLPETTSVTFGDVFYELEATIIRAGAFKSNLVGKQPITLVRTPSEYNLEENEPIVITRDWEDQLRYDIVIGGKSIILESYLPLAFRFVPLWGKVALHRIRVYLSENLEYYCQNKKVHRMEPSKKYLLLEHKAKKGKSLLAKKEDGEYGDENDELLPRELEFQLYVPQTLNGKVNHVLHPDTSFDEIQAHHWIKLSLRISKVDSENPEKRKHYEISIDSPIHVLSPLSAHGNTLLPAYDDHLPQSGFLPEYTPASPPLSPGVTPVDNTQTIGKLFSALSTVNSHSSGHKKLEEPASPSLHPERFYHLNSSNDNTEPIERDLDMHLEANVYKPDPTESRSQLNSPQAMPHVGSLSPVASPALRPIHLLRRPSYNPPPFSADVAPPPGEAPPPAYEEEEAETSSVSPLRSRQGSTNRGRSKTNSSTGSTASSLGNQNTMLSSSSNDVSIRDLLTSSMANIPGTHRNSIASKKSQSSSDSDKKNKPATDRSRPPAFEISPSDVNYDNTSTAASIPASNNEITAAAEAAAEENESEEDIVNLIGSPELIPEAVSPRRNLSPLASPRRGLSPATSPRGALSPAASPRDGLSPTASPILSPSPERPIVSHQLNINRSSEDLHDNEYQSSLGGSSRRTSLTSNDSELIAGQTIPLLSSSTNSLVPNNPPNRTASVSSLLFDSSRRLSSNQRPSIVDFVDGNDLGADFEIRHLQMKMPKRIKNTGTAHIHDPAQVSEEEDDITQEYPNMDERLNKLRQSSIGITDYKQDSASEDSDLTINEQKQKSESNKAKTEEPPKEPHKIEGFKYGFMID